MISEQHYNMGAGGHYIGPKCDEMISHRNGTCCQDECCSKCGAKILSEGSHHHELLTTETFRRKK